MISSAWYAGWHGDQSDFPPEEMSWEKYNVVAYAFALTTENPGDIVVSSEDQPILRKVVKLAHDVVRFTSNLRAMHASEWILT